MRGGTQEIAIEKESGDCTAHYRWLYERFVMWKNKFEKKEIDNDSKIDKRLGCDRSD